MKQIIFLQPAERELEEAAFYYESQKVGLGALYLIEIEKSLASIAESPTAWIVIRQKIRRRLVRRFPFGILYRINKDCIVVVTNKLRAVIDLLILRKPLPRELNDHPLKGKYKGYNDLHIEPDWLLIYKADNNNLWLARTGTHADLFN